MTHPRYWAAARYESEKMMHQIRKLNEEAAALQVARDYLERNVVTSKLSAHIEPDGGDGWRVFIPPYLATHFDGPAILGPYEDTYFDTLEEASAFLQQIMAADTDVIDKMFPQE